MPNCGGKIGEPGLVMATMGDTATHAICRHGRVAKIDADDHACRWEPLVRCPGCPDCHMDCVCEGTGDVVYADGGVYECAYTKKGGEG